VKTWFTVGAVIEAKATSGKWWPAAVISRVHDGGLAFDVDVRDGPGTTKWSACRVCRAATCGNRSVVVVVNDD